MSLSISSSEYAGVDHSFVPATSSDKRSPCPALNALANHGYIPRSGTEIPFSHLLHAVQYVYNLSFPFALFITLVGYVTCAKFSLYAMSWKLNLADLSARGWNKVAHDASLVHPSGIPSHSPDPALLENFLSAGSPSGLTLKGLAAVHVERTQTLSSPLSGFHQQVAYGECALVWNVMRNPETGVIEHDVLAQLFGEERLPKGWWEESRRPRNQVGFIQTRKTAVKFQEFVKNASVSS